MTIVYSKGVAAEGRVARIGLALSGLLVAAIWTATIAERDAVAAPAKKARVVPVVPAKKSRTDAQPPTWETQLVEKIERNKQYPAPAICRGEQGTPKLRFSIDRRGRLLASRIDASSGFPTLDEEILALVRRSQPFPGPPRQRPGSKFEFVVPINFRLPETDERNPLVVKLILNSDLTMALGDDVVDREELGNAVDRAANGNRTRRICLFVAQDVIEDNVSNVTKLLQVAGFTNVTLVRLDKAPMP